MDVMAAVGRRTISGGRYLLDLYLLAFRAVCEIFRRGPTGAREGRRVLLNQVLFTGFDALPVLSLVAVLFGLVVIIQAVTQLPRIGAGEMAGRILVLVIIRELGPLITAVIVLGRSGSAIAVEIGNMRVNQEIEALEMMGVDLFRYLIAPRVLGSVAAVTCLILYFDAVAIMGGFVVAKYKLVVPFSIYVGDLIQAMRFSDLLITLVKGVVFGLTIAVVSVYHGLAVGNSPTEVPQQATKAILRALSLCLVFNVLIAAVMYL